MTFFNVFSDVDGTATNLPGSLLCVPRGSMNAQQELYQSLFVGYRQGVAQPYATTAMLSDDQMVEILTKHFGSFNKDVYKHPDSSMLFSLDAITFYKQVVNNPKATLTFITRNREEYVFALLKYHGFTDEELKKIDIQSTVGNHTKRDVVAEVIQTKNDGLFLILDDSGEDACDMNHAVIDRYPNSDCICVETRQPGQFSWPIYQELLDSYTHNPDDFECHDFFKTRKIKDAMISGIEKYLDYHQSSDKKHCSSNRNQGAGFFSWLRHGQKGINEAKRLKSQILSLDSFDDIINELSSLLSDNHCAYEHHSLSTYLCDELARLEYINEGFLFSKYKQANVVADLEALCRENDWLNN